MKCFLRLLTCVVSPLLLFHLSAAGVLDAKRLKTIAEKELRGAFGDEAKIAKMDFHLPGSVSYLSVERIILQVRRGQPRGSLHIYLKTERGRRRVTVNLKLLWLCSVPRVSEDIARGERIYPWLVKSQREYLERCPGTSVDLGDELIDYVALRNIPEGAILKKRSSPAVRFSGEGLFMRER